MSLEAKVTECALHLFVGSLRHGLYVLLEGLEV